VFFDSIIKEKEQTHSD